METTDVLTLAFSLVGVLFGILSLVIGWVGSRITIKQDEMMEKMDSCKDDLHGVKHDLNERISILAVRMVRLETLMDEERC